MKHQAKQSLAWIIALATSSGLYGGGAWWLKHVAAHHETSDGDHEDLSEHGHETNHDELAESETAHGEPQAEADHHKKEEHHAEVDEHKEKEEHHAEVAEKSNEHHEDSKLKDAKGHASPAGSAPHWTYAKKDATGPAHWGELNEQFSQCERGREQSPIDLKGAVSSASAPQITWHYDPTAVTVENNGHTIMASMPNTQNHIMIGGEKYTLAQFHFHNPSEHKVSGILSEMELHLVHKNDKGGLAVIGVMIQEKAGQENPFITPLWNVLPRELSSKANTTPTMDLAKLLPIHRDYYSYAGSLTTPPCSQGVRWFVMKEPIYFNGSQIERYTGIFDGPTNRPIQPLFGREIIQSSGPASVGH